MMGSGFLSEAVMEKANEKLEAAIEDLRVKYELKAKIEAQEKEVADKAARREEAAIEAKKEGDWAMEDPELETIRKARMAALKQVVKETKGHREAGHGELKEIREDDFLKEVTSTKFVLVHFYHPEFETCKVMDKHLRIIAAKPRGMATKFLKIEAPKATFFVAKLKVKVLPTLVFFQDGIATGRLTGFEGLTTLAPMGGLSTAAITTTAGTDFTTGSLLRALKLSGVLGSAAREAADSESEEEGGEAGSVAAAYAARRAKLMALDADE